MKAMSFKATRTTLFLSLYALLLATFPAASFISFHMSLPSRERSPTPAKTE